MAMPYDGLNDHDDPVTYDDAWRDLIWTIKSCLSKAWRDPSCERWRDGHPSGKVLAINGLHQILIEEDRGGYGYVYVSILPRDDLDDRMIGLARGALDAVADSAFRKLHKEFPLRVPQGYVSAPYQP